jgi:hypothetical protein
MGLGNQKLDLIEQSLYIPYQMFSLDIIEGTPNVIESAAASTTETLVDEVTTFGITGLKMTVAGNKVTTAMPIPNDWARNLPIYSTIIWTHEAAIVGDRDITWKTRYGTSADPLLPNVTMDEVAHTADPPSTAAGGGRVQMTDRQAIGRKESVAAGNDNFADTHRLLRLEVEMDAFDAAFVEDKYFLGILLEYTPKWSRGEYRLPASPYQAD